MQSSVLVALFASLASLSIVGVGGSPIATAIQRRDTPTPSQKQILQFAHSLELMEVKFYSDALARFDEGAFEDAGCPSWVRGRMVQIGQHESSHAKFLEGILGEDAVKPCEYHFPYTDPASFLALSRIIEGVGTSAYLGAAKFLHDTSVLTAAGAILTTEARHNAWVNSAVLKDAAWSGSYDTPLDQNMVFSLAAAFITSCPKDNPSLPFTEFPALSITSTQSESVAVAPGAKVKLAFSNVQSETGPKSRYLALFTGLDTLFSEINANNEATLPDGLQGTVYAVVSNNGTSVTDDSVIAGPAILSFPFSSSAPNP